MSWDEVHLLSVCEVSTGKYDANHGVVNGSYQFYTCAEKPIRSNTYSFEGSSIILPGNGANVGLVLYFDGKFEAYQRTYVLNNFRRDVDSKYVYHHLNRYWKLRNEKAQYGSATNYIRMQNFKDYTIPLPPLDEQKRIAAILDKADAIRQKRKQAIDLADEFLRSVFLDMFGDVSGVGESTVEKLAEDRKGSMRTGPFGSQLLHSEFTESGVSVLGIDNAVKNRFEWGKERFISQDKYSELSRYTVLPGDVLITIMGTCGRCAVVPEGIPVAINTKHLCCITLDKSKCLPEFLHSYFLYHPIARRYLEKNTKGAIMAGLNMGIIKAMPVPVFPLAMQNKYVEIAKKIESSRYNREESETLGNRSFDSISQKVFSGQL
ncbi:restriction endonuclease subunit S [Vibrio vulnificus]|nr:restriction endonuclease subunit S [Vibrio vulnificus]ELV8611760.1 restriction endonuclease subunit S [Vibrio vulnificus]MCU8134223.1 restriction endonuclease subunit S [Vibrio vulnificus]